MTDTAAIERFQAICAEQHRRVYAYAVSMAAQLRAKLKKAPRWEHWTIRVAPPGSGAPHRHVQATALTVTFSGIGQPQRITAPGHAIQQFGRG